MNRATAPLAGLKVLELGQLIAGPFAGRMLGDFGADVIKVEPPGNGDPLRQWRLLHDGTSVWWQVQSRNKRSVVLDLRTDEGRAGVRALAREADVLIENFKPGTLEKWGLGPDQLAHDNPGMVMLRISGYGQTGPYRDLPGFAVVAEAMGGLRHLMGEPGRVPVRAGVSLGDTLAGLHGVIGVLLALQARARDGRGQVVDVALYEAVFNCMESLLPEYSAFGAIRQFDLQTPDGRHRPRRPGPGHSAGQQRPACRPGRRARRRHHRLDRAAPRQRGGGHVAGVQRAGGPHLHGEGHRRGPALPGPRHAAGRRHAGWTGVEGAWGRAAVVRHTRPAGAPRTAAGRA